MIIFRYLAREVFNTSIAVTLVLMLIFLSNQFIRFLTITAAGKLPGMKILYLLLLEVPQLTAVLFPLGLYIGILLAYGRLYADSEMVVLTACGVSFRRLLIYTMSMAIAVFVIVSFLSLWAAPKVSVARDQALDQISATSALQSLIPGRFQAAEKGTRVYYIGNMSADRKQLQHIFVADQKKSTDPNVPESWSVMAASSGYYHLDPKTHDQFVVATNGHAYQGIPGEKNFQTLQFGEYGLRIQAPPLLQDNEIDSIPTPQLMLQVLQHKLAAEAEMQWRVAMPISVILLTLLALTLSKVKPRQGKYAKLFPAVLIYIIYVNMILVAQNWVESGTLKPIYGLWWIHISLAILTSILYGVELGWFRRIKNKFFMTRLWKQREAV